MKTSNDTIENRTLCRTIQTQVSAGPRLLVGSSTFTDIYKTDNEPYPKHE